MITRKTRSVGALASLTLVAALSVTACGDSSGQTADPNKIVVVTSTQVWGSVVRAVGGDLVTVRSIISGSTGDPHGYEAKPADTVAFDGAKLALSNGGGYDDFFAGLTANADKSLRTIVAVDVAQHEKPAEGEHDHANEHVWYDFHAVHEVADKVAAELSAIAPEHKDKFAANATAFAGKLDALTAKAKSVGKPGAKVVATEPVAGYLLEAAGLTDATPHEFSEAVEEETDPPASAIAAMQDLISGKQVVALVYNEQTETSVTKSVKAKATEAGIPVVTMTESFPDGVNDYVEWMTKQVDALVGTLAAR